MPHTQRALVILPTYNERENIEKIIHAVLPLDPRINVLVVDDNSPDGTGEIADKMAGQMTKVNVRISLDSSGLSNENMTIYLRWTPIFLMVPNILRIF